MRPEWGTSLVFTASGVVQSSWFSRLPSVRERLDVDFARLGLALLVLGAGTLLAMGLVGIACRRFGSRRVVVCAAILGCGALAVAGTTRSFIQLIATLFGLGLALGAWDGAMNIQGVALERARRRHGLTMLHGWWSVGSIAGAGLGVAAVRAELSLTAHLGLVAVGGAAACLFGTSGFTDDGPARRPLAGQRPGGATSRRFGLVATLLLLGATIEGAAGDWLAIYLADHYRLPHAGASTGYAVFVVAVAGGRFIAHRVQHTIGVPTTVRSGAALAAFGVLLVVSAPVPDLAMIGALCWGLGICAVFPAAISAIGRVGSDSTVAVMTGIGYGAGLVGPLAIGMLADANGLGPALLVLPVLAVILIVFARYLDPTAADRS